MLEGADFLEGLWTQYSDNSFSCKLTRNLTNKRIKRGDLLAGVSEQPGAAWCDPHMTFFQL